MSSVRGQGAVPDAFARAYAGLADLVGRIAMEGSEGGPGVTGLVGRWEREDCAGSGTLARAAALALRHEINAEAEDEGALRAVQAVERVLWPPETEEIPPPVGVELAEGVARALGPGALGVRMGELEALASRGEAGMQMSVSHPRRYPYWRELLAARTAFGRGAPALWARLPPDSGEEDPDPPAGPPYLVMIFEHEPRPHRGDRSGPGGH